MGLKYAVIGVDGVLEFQLGSPGLSLSFLDHPSTTTSFLQALPTCA